MNHAEGYLRGAEVGSSENVVPAPCCFEHKPER